MTVHRDKFLIINQLDAPISQIYVGMKLYVFRTVPLSIIRSFSLHTQQWYMSYRFADSLQAGSGCSVNEFLIINQLDAPISQICFEMKLYIFRAVLLSIIRSFPLYTRQRYISYRFADSLQAGSEWKHIPLSCVQWETPDDGRRNCPKHVVFHFKINMRNWCI